MLACSPDRLRRRRRADAPRSRRHAMRWCRSSFRTHGTRGSRHRRAARMTAGPVRPRRAAPRSGAAPDRGSGRGFPAGFARSASCRHRPAAVRPAPSRAAAGKRRRARRRARAAGPDAVPRQPLRAIPDPSPAPGVSGRSSSDGGRWRGSRRARSSGGSGADASAGRARTDPRHGPAAGASRSCSCPDATAGDASAAPDLSGVSIWPGPVRMEGGTPTGRVGSAEGL